MLIFIILLPGNNKTDLFFLKMNQFCLTVLYFLPTIFCIFADSDTYVNKFAVHIEGGERVARSVAETHGFIHIGQVRILLLIIPTLLIYYILIGCLEDFILQ